MPEPQAGSSTRKAVRRSRKALRRRLRLVRAPWSRRQPACGAAAFSRAVRRSICAFASAHSASSGSTMTGVDDLHDLVAVGVMRAELAALVGVEAALEQGAEDRGVDVGPVELRGVGSGRRCRPVSRGRASSSSNRPPLNQSTGSKPTVPPAFIAPNSVRGVGGEARRARRGAASASARTACRAAGRRPRRTCRTPAG